MISRSDVTADLAARYCPRRNELRPPEAGPTDACVRIDMHCHSTYSAETLHGFPGMVYHPLLTPGEHYDLAKARGMDFVTLTDHNTIAGCLALLEQRGPLPDFIVGEEVTAVFPDDGMEVHVNVYGHDEPEHRQIQRLRRNVYDLVDYLEGRGRLFVLNHPTWNAAHVPICAQRFAEFLDLFAVMEGLNGSRTIMHNLPVWRRLAPAARSVVAGSDSHTDRVGTAYTLTHGRTRQELFDNIRAGRTTPCGQLGSAAKTLEDTLLLLDSNLRRMTDQTGSAWRRLGYRAVQRFGPRAASVFCKGYYYQQSRLLRRLEQAGAAV